MKPTQSLLEQENRYRMLSIKDILEARDAYHVFLTQKTNVIGTAIGKNRVRIKGVDRKEPKTLENTEVRSNSWPCILVFVKEWIRSEKFGVNQKVSADDFLPTRLYLPDGRIVPVCVIETRWVAHRHENHIKIKFPGSVIGGGYPVFTNVQGEERFATLGCLVTDGRLTFALTNAHVAGRPGENLYTLKNGNEDDIGISSHKQLLKKSFSEVYEGLPGKHSFINLDIGLIELDDIQNISSQVFGIGELKGVADINHDTLSLNLIGCHLKGFGCSSGLMKGEIIGLFYRYSSSGGYDNVADYLVGPTKENKSNSKTPFIPTYGDSGTLMIIDEPKKEEHMKVLGVLWGGQKDMNNKKIQPYGLVTNFGTVCRLLDIELVHGWNKNYDNYFAAYAHTVLPSWCPDYINNRTLKALMTNNALRFSLPISSTKVKETKGLSNLDFIYLSDVPDLVWKSGRHKRGKEGPNHFADMDQPNEKGKTLIDICTDVANVDPAIWEDYYLSVKAEQKGTLPFRIALIFDAMSDYARKNKREEFVCAAGILVHYTFDAAMPLHISYLHHGNPDGSMKLKKLYGKEKQVPLAYEVHEEFDTQMVEYYAKEICKKLPGFIKKIEKTTGLLSVAEIKTKQDAAIAAVQLMSNTIKNAPPESIVKDFEKYASLQKRERCDLLWKEYNEGLMMAMAEAVILTTRLWEAAWTNGDGISKNKNVDAITEKELKKLYESSNFLKSLNLAEIKEIWNQ